MRWVEGTRTKMTGSRQPINRITPPGSWLQSSNHLIQYGISIIRQDGLAYFFKRLLQFISIKLSTFYQSIRIKLWTQGDSRYIKVEDIHPSPEHLHRQLPEKFPHQPEGHTPEQPLTSASITGYHEELVLQGISSQFQNNLEREALLQQGRERFSNRRVVFVSPIGVLGGGANLIILATKAMRRMGVDAQILNLNIHRTWFERNYPDLKLPVVFGDIEDVPRLVNDYDAVIATSNPTVSWIASAAKKRPDLVMGYYIQDYEPYFYPQDSHEFQRANASYIQLPNLVRMVTTQWISDQIEFHHHVLSNIVGSHLDTDLFQPRPRTEPSWPERALRIVAMIRPTTPRRNPKMTMAILQQASKMYQSRLEITLFGCDLTDPGFAALDQDFPWQIAGQLRSTQIANLLNEADIFVDFSEFQALGLSALEAMATGLAVVVPANGGTNVYAKHEWNCLVVDSHDQQASFTALQRLIEDDALRLNLQGNAVPTAAKFFSELPALNMLEVLFPVDK
jgi:glycosyltransferase involved in cell wall biosynthesis